MKKPTDTGIILNFRSCAPLQLMKNVIQGRVHRVFNATSNCLAFDQTLEENKTCWTKNQYQEEWSSKTLNQNLEKIINGKAQLRTRKTPKQHQKNKTRSQDMPTIFLQNRGNLTQSFANKLKKLCESQLVFITQKLRSSLPNHLSTET